MNNNFEHEGVDENTVGNQGNGFVGVVGNRGNGAGNGRRMSIHEHISQRREGVGSAINLPPLPPNISLIFSTNLLSNIKDNTFNGTELEDAQEHVETIEDLMVGFNVAGVDEDGIMLRVFPKTLGGGGRQRTG